VTGRLRVLHVIRPESAGSIGGADLHVIDLCAAQNESELCQAEILALDASADFLYRAQQAGAPAHDPLRPRRGRWRRLASLPRRVPVDLIHAHGYEADYLAAVLPAIAPAWRTLPAVMTCHGIITPDVRHHIMSWFDLRCMRRSKALITVAKHSARTLNQAVPGIPVYPICNGVTAPRSVPDRAKILATRQRLGTGNHELLIGYVGRLSGEKRPDLFLKMAATLVSRFDHLRFAVVGGGTLDASIRRTAANSMAADRIVFTGLRHDMDQVYAALDILVLPSDTEGTSRVVLEAQLRGVPVVASAIGGVRELIEHQVTGLLVNTGQHTETAAAVSRLVTDTTLRQQLTYHARISARERTPCVMAKAVQQIYQQTLQFGIQ
jgi:glycosyltransferase involved in cell wall biosynthesis